MARITVTLNGASTSPIIWVSMTPWTHAPMTSHVSVPGGVGEGVTFPKGADNAVTTITGRCPWTSAGQQMYDSLPGARITVSNGVDTRTGIVTQVTPNEQSPAWIYFTLSVTEV